MRLTITMLCLMLFTTGCMPRHQDKHIEIIQSDEAPEIVGHSFYSVYSDEVKRIPIMVVNEDDLFDVYLLTRPKFGDVEIIDGKIFYYPMVDYHAVDSFIVVANDGYSESEGFPIEVEVIPSGETFIKRK